MEQLKKVGKVSPKNSKDIKYSKIGLGFEKLDRDVFDPGKAYDKVAECGVKWARIQSGWQRTEKQKGVYDFGWIDSVVDNFLSRGIKPWICLCYGNKLYTEIAKEVFGAVGCAPIFSDEEKCAWINYVKAIVEHFKGKVTYFEIWNESDWIWKPKANAQELGEFTIATAKAIKEVNPDAKTIGVALAELNNIAFMSEALATGMGDYLDFISFHKYTRNEKYIFETANTIRALAKAYNPKLEIIQGESGSQSKSYGHGALSTGAWTENIQAKQLARRMIADLMTDVHFTSYFSCLDMIEGLLGNVNDKASYLDYGYFGVLGASFDESGRSTGEYYKKPSYYALQNICSIFSNECKPCTIPTVICSEYSKRKFDYQPEAFDLISGGFEKENGKAFVYWYPSNIMTTSYESSINIKFFTQYDKVQLVDIMDGTIYDIPRDMIEDLGGHIYRISELPVRDTPLLLTFGDFLS